MLFSSKFFIGLSRLVALLRGDVSSGVQIHKYLLLKVKPKYLDDKSKRYTDTPGPV